MKHLKLWYVGVVCFFFIVKVNAQETEPVLARARYQFIHVNDTANRDHPKEEEMVLYAGINRSFFTSNAEEEINRQMEEQVANPSFDGNINLVSKGSSTNESFYFVSNTQTLKRIYRLMQNQYILDEPYPQLDWKINDDTLTIGGYNCQKATVSFKGRTYTAWFSPELPFSFGPWKLHGLPGLILDVADSKKEVVFHFVGFEKLDHVNLQIGTTTDYIEINQEALDRLLKVFKENRQTFMDVQGQGGRSNAANVISGLPKKEDAFSSIDPGKIKSINVNKNAGGVSNTDNNPIELTK